MHPTFKLYYKVKYKYCRKKIFFFVLKQEVLYRYENMKCIWELKILLQSVLLIKYEIKQSEFNQIYILFSWGGNYLGSLV